MTIAKQVSFIERIDKSGLGIKGLQYVVYCDRSRNAEATVEEIKNEEYNFYKIGNKMLKEIDGKYIIDKFNLEPGIEFGKKLHSERVKWMKVNKGEI